MRSLFLLILAVGLIGSLLIFVFYSDPADSLELGQSAEDPQTDVVIADSSNLAGEAESIGRSKVEVAAAGEEEESEAPVGPPWLTGRCLSAVTGEALTGVSVRMNGWAESGISRSEDGISYESKKDETGEDGVFAIHLEPHPKRQYR
ncbi:MAG: hypothetical protein ACYTG5_22715, partial [Planctomycetota bacterium]